MGHSWHMLIKWLPEGHLLCLPAGGGLRPQLERPEDRQCMQALGGWEYLPPGQVHHGMHGYQLLLYDVWVPACTLLCMDTSL